MGAVSNVVPDVVLEISTAIHAWEAGPLTAEGSGIGDWHVWLRMRRLSLSVR